VDDTPCATRAADIALKRRHILEGVQGAPALHAVEFVVAVYGARGACLDTEAACRRLGVHYLRERPGRPFDVAPAIDFAAALAFSAPAGPYDLPPPPPAPPQRNNALPYDIGGL
jgi:hypothetical protein